MIITHLELIPSSSVYILIALFSLMIGSFLNVVISRLPIMLSNEMEDSCRDYLKLPPKNNTETFNLFLPRSRCCHCNHGISAMENIPILSYVFLRGRCKHCHKPISFRYPLVELLTCVFALYATWHFGVNAFLLTFVFLFGSILICLFFIDLDCFLLPDQLTLSLLWLGLIANTQSLFTNLPDAVLSAAGGYLVLWVFIQLFYLLTGKIGMGHGDFKLFAAFGAWFGWTKLPFILLFASIMGAIVGFLYLHRHNKPNDTPIPFGPFLCVFGLIFLFWGDRLMSAYTGFFFHHSFHV